MVLRNRGPKANPLDARFIGRENILEDFAREWSKSIDESRRFIVNLHGLGGIGKSKLLQQFLLRHAQEEMVCKLDANFDDLNDPLAVIKAILRKTRHADKPIEFEGTQELIARFEKLVNEAAKSSGELPSAITKVLVKGAQVGGELLGGNETGKLVRDVGESAADLIEVGFEKLASVWRTAKDEKDAKLLDAPVREITDKLGEEINGHCKDDTRFILAIDTYEKIPPSVDRWLLKDWLVEHEEQIKFDLRLLIAGREPLTEVNRHWHDEWGGELLAFKVEPFTLEETSALLLQRRDIVDPQIIEKIHNSTRGYPFWLDLWANSGIDPEHFFSTSHLQKIEDRLFEMFPNPKHQNWLRQGAFFYRFNQDLLAILIKDDVDKAFEWLVHQSSLVEGSEKYWKLHDLARKVILTNLRNRSQALLAEPAGKILQHFQQQLQNPWEKWRDLRLRLILSEQDLQVISEISYYQALTHAQITDEHLDMIIRVLDSGLDSARNLLNLACQALNDVDSRVPEKVIFAQSLVETVSSDIKEEELDQKKSELLRLSFSDYQRTILLNRVAKAYDNKLKRSEKALDCFDEILAACSEYENALLTKAKLISKTDPESAIVAANNVLANNPNHENAIFELGYCYSILGKYADAIDQFKKAIEINPKDSITYANWAWTLGKLGRREEAIEQIKKAIAIDPRNAWAYNHWGWSLMNLGRHEEAIEQFKKAVEIDPKFILAYDNWGWSLGKLSRYEEAIEQCKKIIEIDPKYTKAYSRWGWNLGNLDRHEEAIEQYKKAIEIDSKYIHAYNNWTWSLCQLDRHEEAIELIKKAIEINPKDIWTYCTWGNILRDLKHYEEAIEQYNKVIEVDPKHIRAYNSRGLTYSYIGKLDFAIADYAEALKIDSTDLACNYNMVVVKKRLNSDDSAEYIEKVRSLCENLSKTDARVFYALAGLAAVESDSVVALEMLRQAAEIDFQFVKECAPSDIAFESIRNTPEFQAIFREINKCA